MTSGKSGRSFPTLGDQTSPNPPAEPAVKQPQASLQDLELPSVLDAMSAESVLLSEDGRILAANAAWRRFAENNGARSDYVGVNYLEVCAVSAASGDQTAALVLAGLRKVLSGRSQSYRHVYTCADRIFRLRAVPVSINGGGRAILVQHEDVSALAQARRALRSAARQMMSIQEEERRRLASELHDSTGQHLFAIKLGLRAIERGQHDEATIAAMRHALDEANRQIRTISYLLYAPRPEDDFEDAIKRLVQGFASRSGIACPLSFQGRIGQLPREVEQAVTRVLQEGLLNVYRHAGATRAKIVLAMDSRGLTLKVIDDGIGARDERFKPGVGITSMASRLQPFGGRLMVTPSRSGTTLCAVIPPEALSLSD